MENETPFQDFEMHLTRARNSVKIKSYHRKSDVPTTNFYTYFKIQGGLFTYIVSKMGHVSKIGWSRF